MMMARFLPLTVRLFSSSRPSFFSSTSSTSSPPKKKALILTASDVSIACGLNPFAPPSEIVRKYWKRTSLTEYNEMVKFIGDQVSETFEEKATRLAHSTATSHHITQFALETTQNAETTPAIHEATKELVDRLESVDEPSQPDKQRVVQRVTQDFEALTLGVKETLEKSQMEPEEKALAKARVEESIQTAMSGIQASVEALSSASPQPKAELKETLDQTLEENQQNLTNFVDGLQSSPDEEKREIASMLDSQFSKAKESLQLEVAGLRPALSPEDKAVVAKHYLSTINKGFGERHEHGALDSYEKGAKVEVGSRNDQWYSRVMGRTKMKRWVVLGGRVDGITDDGKVVEVKNRLHEFKDPLPVYDLVQLQTYLFVTRKTTGQLVEQLKGEESETKSTLVKWDSPGWYQTILPRLARFSNAFEMLLDDELSQVMFLKADDKGKEAIFGRLLEGAPSKFLPYSKN